MLCKVTKDQASVLNVLGDQAFNILTGPVAAAAALVATSGVDPCMKSNALIHALLNHLMLALIAHRQTHGELKDLTNLGALKKNPEAFMALAGDVNELMSAVLRGIDTKNDYMLNLFKMEKKAVVEGGEAKP